MLINESLKKIRIANYILSGVLLLLIIFSCVKITFAISHTWSQIGDVAITVAQGGTGQSSLTANNVILGNGASAVAFVAPGTANNILESDGSTWASAAPSGTMMFSNRSVFGSGTTYCHPIQGACGTSAATLGAEVLFAGAIKNLNYIMNTAPSVNSSCTLTVRKATLCSGTFADTALTCTITGDGSTKACLDSVNSVSISANDCLQIATAASGTCGTGNSWSFQYAY
ncbi:MAG: hypothetical protein V1902_01300 [Candidatus Falkowbacteria bacterium]